MKEQNRRKFMLYSLAILGGGVLSAWVFRRDMLRKFLFTFPDNPSLKLSASPTENEVCVLTAKQVEGPFYFPSPERSDIVEDRKGSSLKLNIQVVDHPNCSPIKNAIVEIWQADAEGSYSGYPEQISQDEWKMFMLFGKHGEKKDNGEYTVPPVTESRYLRGLQRTDENGWVTFKTIIPCWYIARVPHIHFKVFINDKEHINSQLYFEKDFCDDLFTSEAPYDKMGKCPIEFKNDGVLSSVQGEQSGLVLSVQKDDNSNYVSTCRVGIKSERSL